MARRVFRMLSVPLLLASAAVGAGSPAPAVGTAPPPAPPPAATIPLFRIETTDLGVLWSADHPLQTGDLVTFHKHPDGALVSVRRAQIRKVSAERVLARAPGVVDIGVTAGGGGRRDATVSGANGGVRKAATGPGERADGTALLNPDRKYQPDIDSKQVPGMNLAFPASSNDYREGKTFAYPAPAAVQTSPGAPPTMPDPPPPKPN